jgi:hypothetical protein
MSDVLGVGKIEKLMDHPVFELCRRWRAAYRGFSSVCRITKGIAPERRAARQLSGPTSLWVIAEIAILVHNARRAAVKKPHSDQRFDENRVSINKFRTADDTSAIRPNREG